MGNLLNLFKRPAETSHSYEFLATNLQLKEMLARQIAPILEGEGYQYNNSYRWLGPWRNHCRQIVQVRLLKGASGEFAWGYCFDFLPVLQNDLRAYRYQRTDKSADLQLFAWTSDLLSPADAEWRAYRFSQFGANPEDVEQRLLCVFQRSKLLGDKWFQDTQGPERLYKEAERQSQKKNYHWPAPTYIKAFLLSALGRPAEGLEEFNAWFAGDHQIPAELQEKLRKKLEDCANSWTESV